MRSSRTVGLIACNNGFGHLRRILLIARDLLTSGVDVLVFGDEGKIQRLSRQFSLPKIEIFDFQVDAPLASEEREVGELNTCLLESIALELSQLDLVVSDNLPEILSVCPNAVLSGNFFWHELDRRASSAYKHSVEAMIQSERPRHLSYGPFNLVQSTQWLREFNVSIPQPEKQENKSNRNGVLISAGGGGSARDLFVEAVQIVRKSLTPKLGMQLFLDPHIERPLSGTNEVCADYFPSMFSEISCAIIRPGFGTISDCIHYGVFMICLHEEENLEMSLNAQAVVNCKIGEIARTASEAESLVHDFLYDEEKQAVFCKKMSQLKKSMPVMGAAEFICEWLQ